VALGSFTHRDRKGANSFHFTGRVNRHRLAPGSYRLQAVSRSAPKAVAGKPVSAGFTIIR
jgi:hypothetical protein